MANQSTDILATIGAIQTLVENFPMGLLSALNVKKYNSSLDFLIDTLRTLGINDKELISFLLETIVGVGDLDFYINTDVELPDDMDQRVKNNAFVQTLESSIKFLLSEILANIVSCSVWPKIPSDALDDGGGYNLPLTILDPTGLLNTCPISDNGRKLYSGIVYNNKTKTGTTISDLGGTGVTDMNAFIWYCLNYLEIAGTKTWGNKDGLELCSFTNLGYKSIKMALPKNEWSGKTLFEFNKKYLDSITIFSPKIILTNIINELLNGLPNVEVNLGIEEIYSEAVFKKMIDTVVTNDDMDLNECYYTFSNEDWNRMLEDADLKRYNAKKYGDKTNTANVIDKEKVNDLLNEAAQEETMFDRTQKVTEAIYTAAKTHTVEYDLLSEEASINKQLTVDYEVNTAWLYNIISTIIRPIVKAAMSPKVMALIIVNYEIAGALNLSEININSPMDTILSFVKQKMLGLFAALIKKIKDIVVKAVLDLFNKQIQPLIAKFMAAKLLEQLENYTDLLRQAMECIDIFGFPYILGNGLRTNIEEVNYADITHVKNNPVQDTC